ncbi:MAG: hypothetical protein JNM30_19185 [Rhodospirillales bacterium]|nr:hypothetical protein [Rhodospirillales bacterium]
MTAVALPMTATGASPALALFRREPIFAAGALVLLALAAPMLVAFALEQRTLLGENLWIKPLKFALALATYLATLAWYAGFLPPGTTAARWYRVYAGAVLVAVAGEMAWIGGAAMHGVPSHFNIHSPAMAAAYQLMGVFAVFLTTAAPVYGILILRDRRSRLDAAFRLSLGVGLILTFALTVAAAGAMAQRLTHSVGEGDLRVAHFFATHAMHAVPLAGFLAGRLLPVAAARACVAAFALLYTGFVAWTFLRAWSGHALL